jgi:hypothetical protein
MVLPTMVAIGCFTHSRIVLGVVSPRADLGDP